jgi:anti-sigma-K factor RskA
MNGHPQFEEDFELYEFGVLDGGDKAEFETHLASCPECLAKLGAARSFVAKLALSAPESDPSPAVRERVLDTFRAHALDRRRVAQPFRPRREIWTQASGWAMAAICIVLFVGAAWLACEDIQLTRRLAELERNREALESSRLVTKAAAARAEAVLEVLTSSQTVQVDLSSASAHPVPHGKAFYNRAHGLLFYTTNLNLLSPDRTYELWLIPTEGKPLDIAIFKTDTQGNGQVLLTSLPSGLTAKAFAVTIEPVGGVPAPTGPMVLIGPVT